MEVRNSESLRSSRPPWPGMMVPESLNPEFRLMRLYAKSPSTPMQPEMMPKTIA